MTTKRKATVKAVEFPETARMMPATQGMLRLVRDELIHRIAASDEHSAARTEELRKEVVELHAKVDALDAKFEARIDALDAKVDALDAKFEAKIDALDAKINALDAKFEAKIDALDAKIDARFHELKGTMEELRVLMARNLALNEEQTAQNGIALEAVAGMIKRQDRLEKRQGELEELVYSFVRANRARET